MEKEKSKIVDKVEKLIFNLNAYLDFIQDNKVIGQNFILFLELNDLICYCF